MVGVFMVGKNGMRVGIEGLMDGCSEKRWMKRRMVVNWWSCP